MKDKINFFHFVAEKDERQKKNGWVPGWYAHISCNQCKKPYIGHRRSVICAACAYDDKQL